jgi:hypothetical protein
MENGSMTETIEFTETITDKRIAALAAARAESERWNDELDRLEDEFSNRPEVIEAREKRAAYNVAIGQLTAAIKLEAQMQFVRDGNKAPHPAVKVREMTKLEYDPDFALTWCKSNMQSFLELDKTAFEKYAKAVIEVAPVPGVKLVTVPQATIASNLSEYLPKPEELPFD